MRASATDGVDPARAPGPSEIWRITRKPTEPTTTAQSTTMAVTTRVRSDRRQNDGRLRPRAARPDQASGSGVSRAGSSAAARLVADPAHGHHDLGFSGSTSILARSRWTWTLTSRVSAACR